MPDPASHPADPPLPQPAPRCRVLVADDSRAQRHVLATALRRWGYAVEEAASGTEALARLSAGAFDFVLSDWMMPGLDGPSLCRRFRALPRDGYTYVILLTAKTGREEVAQGLAAGADDFLSKPVNLGELHARILAGERILKIERELVEKNRLVTRTLEEMSAIYAALDRDLIEARKFQMTLVRERERDFGAARVAVTLRPSGHVGGDLVGYLPLSARRVVFYAIDVAGHGVASAIMAARLAGTLSAANPDGNALAMSYRDAVNPWPPEIVATRLNHVVLEQLKAEQYFTCVYAEADLVTGRVALVQAGHPHPILLRADGGTERVGNGGLPVGLIPQATYERVELRLRPGDRLLLVSDGLTEAADAQGRELGESGLLRLVEKNRALGGGQFLDALVWDVEGFAADTDFTDDISAVLFEFRGPG